jgi:hypothetical protein
VREEESEFRREEGSNLAAKGRAARRMKIPSVAGFEGRKRRD